jgi:hypothetical protein
VAGGLCLEVANPVFRIAAVNANAQGVALLTITLPATVPQGAQVAFQAVALRGVGGADSTSSNPVLRVISAGPVAMGDVQAGELVISEIMQNPNAVADSAGEWFEIYNGRAEAVDLFGLEVSDTSGASFAVDSAVIVPPNGYAVVGGSAAIGSNGGVVVDHVWSGFSLGNTSDDLCLF